MGSGPTTYVHVHEDAWTYSCTLASMHVYIIALAPIQDYISQESAWSSNCSTFQRKYLATSKVFAESICKSIYTSTDFQISEGLHRGPEFSHLHHRLPHYLHHHYLIIAKKWIATGDVPNTCIQMPYKCKSAFLSQNHKNANILSCNFVYACVARRRLISLHLIP